MKKLSGKAALITGAGRGIGRATAILFAEHGANLILVSRTAEELRGASQLCADRGVKAVWRTLDLSEGAQIDSFLDDVLRIHPRIDILVNNAARFDRGLMRQYPIERFEVMLRTNLLAPFYLAQKCLATMGPATGGAIVNISSYSGCFGVEKYPGFGAYNISKYGLWGLTEILALENQDRGIRVNQISLSGVDTKMFREAFPQGGRPDLTPEEVAEKILFLASDDSAPMTGMNIMMPEPDGE